MNVQAPRAMPYGVSAEQAVMLCRDWMIHLGAADTVELADSRDEVCDLYSSRYVAWVDNRRGNLDIDAVVAAAAVASGDGRQALIFKRGGVRPDAQRRADELGVALFSYVAIDGLLEGANLLGYELRAVGLTGSTNV